jgi:hypothetical protein
VGISRVRRWGGQLSAGGEICVAIDNFCSSRTPEPAVSIPLMSGCQVVVGSEHRPSALKAGGGRVPGAPKFSVPGFDAEGVGASPSSTSLTVARRASIPSCRRTCAHASLVVCRGFGDSVEGGLSAGDFVEDLVGCALSRGGWRCAPLPTRRASRANRSFWGSPCRESFSRINRTISRLPVRSRAPRPARSRVGGTGTGRHHWTWRRLLLQVVGQPAECAVVLLLRRPWSLKYSGIGQPNSPAMPQPVPAASPPRTCRQREDSSRVGVAAFGEGGRDDGASSAYPEGNLQAQGGG